MRTGLPALGQAVGLQLWNQPFLHLPLCVEEQPAFSGGARGIHPPLSDQLVLGPRTLEVEAAACHQCWAPSQCWKLEVLFANWCT